MIEASDVRQVLPLHLGLSEQELVLNVELLKLEHPELLLVGLLWRRRINVLLLRLDVR